MLVIKRIHGYKLWHFVIATFFEFIGPHIE